MPTVSVEKEELFRRLELDSRTFTDEQFDELCFQFGIELDEVTLSETTPPTTQYKIDIPANRYDLLCIEGIALALQIFTGKRSPVAFQTVTPKEIVTTFVDKSVENVRPFVVTGVLRGVVVTQPLYNSLIDLQEKLHHNICRKRQFVAIGVHDMSKVTPPFTYTAEKPSDIKFRPLNQTKEFTAEELMEFYQKDNHLKHYLHILKGEELYPVIRDKGGVVLSMPPIINGDQSKIGVDSKKKVDLFFECTATDLKKAQITLDTLLTMFSTYTNFTAEQTSVIYNKETIKELHPNFTLRKIKIPVSKACQIIGVELTAEEIAKNLKKMSLPTEIMKKENELIVSIPPTRHDIIHPCDLYEDVAISYGYDKILEIAHLPKTMTIARQNGLNKLSDGVREHLAMAGWTEVLTFSLTSLEDAIDKMRLERSKVLPTLALISNPKTIEFQTARGSLIPGLLKTIQANKKMPLPLRVFEVSDVVGVDCGSDTGTINRRKVAALIYNKSPGFEQLHGLLDRLLQILEASPHSLKASESPSYFPGRAADIVSKEGKKIGEIGVLHPEVCSAFELVCPVAVFEIDLEGFL